MNKNERNEYCGAISTMALLAAILILIIIRIWQEI